MIGHPYFLLLVFPDECQEFGLERLQINYRQSPWLFATIVLQLNYILLKTCSAVDDMLVEKVESHAINKHIVYQYKLLTIHAKKEYII